MRANANELINRLKDLNGLFMVSSSLVLSRCATPKIVEKLGLMLEIGGSAPPFCGFRAVKKRLDEFDLKLLEQIQQNNRFSADELAEKVCLSPSSVQRRLRRLRQAKIIERELAIVSPEALGRSLTAIVEVTLDTDRPKAVEEFQRGIQAMPDAGLLHNRKRRFHSDCDREKHGRLPEIRQPLSLENKVRKTSPHKCCYASSEVGSRTSGYGQSIKRVDVIWIMLPETSTRCA
jgi:DNA-binding Lrp family transcriptional regulator